MLLLHLTRRVTAIPTACASYNVYDTCPCPTDVHIYLLEIAKINEMMAVMALMAMADDWRYGILNNNGKKK